jgi:hypothetical protein
MKQSLSAFEHGLKILYGLVQLLCLVDDEPEIFLCAL